jgi:hypothetical protein
MSGYSLLPQSIERLPQLEHDLARHFATAAWRDHDRNLAGVHPSIESGLADTEDLGCTGTRERWSKLGFELPADGRHVGSGRPNSLGSAEPDDVVDET